MLETMVKLKHKPTLGRVRLSLDRKVTPFAVQKGERLNNAISRGIRNTFGLPAVVSCQEGMTKFCDDCYAASIEDIPSVMDKVWHNWMTFKPHLDNSDELLRLMEPMVAECVDEMVRLGVPEEEWIFRHLWDGDIPSYEFLEALMRLSASFPRVQFWVYTRSFGYVRQYLDNPIDAHGDVVILRNNFSLYLSVDEYNKHRLVELNLLGLEGTVDYAFCGDTFADTEKLARGLGMRPMLKCPEQTGRTDLVEWGTAETERGKRLGQGACAKCQYCVYGNGNVQFAVHPNRYGGEAMTEVYGVEDCNTCGDTGRWESIVEEAPTVLVDLGPCPDCDQSANWYEEG